MTVLSLYPRLDPAIAATAEATLSALQAAQTKRHGTDSTWPLRSDEWLAEMAVDAAVRGTTITHLWR